MYPSAIIRYKMVDGLIILLDLRAGEYIVLNRVASAMWNVTVTLDDIQARISDLVRQFDASAAQLEIDLVTFAEDCVARGFLQTLPASPPVSRLGGKVHAPRATLAWRSLLTTAYRLSRSGFGFTYQKYSRLPFPYRQETDGSPLITQATQAFLRAENFFPLRSAPQDCLPRSLALYRFCLAAGLPARHVIGVRRLPFAAHAWVECAGQPLLDDPADIATYSVLAYL